MLIKLILANFKRHENLVIDLSGGLVVVRGANEAGKSTIFQAVAYAFYGARALPSTLEATVTYGKPVTSLRVTLTFTHVGVEYTITRSKSGAKLEGNGITAEGQSEVTGFIEKLFGVPAATSPQLMIASQNKLRGALEGGTSAIDLIEKLSDLDLIDDLITKVQTKLPAGQTKPLEVLIANLQQEVEPTWDEVPYKKAITETMAAHNEAFTIAKDLEDALCQIDVTDSHNTVTNAARAKGEQDSLRQRKSRVVETIRLFEANHHTSVVHPIVDTGELRKRKQQQLEAVALFKTYQQFLTIPETEVQFQMSGAELLNLVKEHEAQVGAISGETTKLKVQRATVAGKRINDEACGLCGKLLQDVPEVVSGNTLVDSQVATLDKQIAINETEQERLTHSVKDMRKALALHTSRREAAAKLGDFIETIDVVPLQCKWKGSAPKSPELVDYDQQIKAAELAASEAARVTAQLEQARQELADIEKRLPEIVIPDTTQALEDIKRHGELTAQLKKANELVAQESMKATQAKHAYEVAHTNYTHAYDSFQKTQAQIREQQALLATYNANNALIKKLREARPVVARELWALVLHGVSHYFSQTRGVPSIVSRGDSGFMVDGKPAADLSGSTLDSLGLAIRMALQKTFLPTLDFMMLDEPASGMDDNRETAMLGLLAASGYNQVVLVTHSPLADAFASQVVQI